jgi:6-phosphogluconolactonase
MNGQHKSASKISLFIVDVDGSLVNEDKVLTPRAQSAVKALNAAGIAFAITSGRPPRGMAMPFEPLDLRTPIAGFNGGIFIKPDMTIIEEHLLPPDAAKRAVKLILNHRMDVPIPATNIHPVQTEGLTPELAASNYERELKSFYGAERLDPARPLFDVTLRGLGADGHTASLFPGTAVLEERARWVAAVVGPKPTRITLTYPALESSRHVAFLVAGKEKREIFSRFQRGEHTLPAARLHPIGTLHLFADAAAAADISPMA